MRKNYDYINPAHYKKEGKQVWELMVDKWGAEKFVAFCEMNAFKYHNRMGLKPDEPKQLDQAKADWYESKAKEILEKMTLKDLKAEMQEKEQQQIPQLIEMVKQWHYDRNLIEGATSKDQVLKLVQEVGELSDSVCKERSVKDDIGDCLVILINIAEREGTSLDECLQVAYNDIKNRKGKLIDGVFIKESDLDD